MARAARLWGLGFLVAHLLGCLPVIPFYRDDTVSSALMSGERGDRMRQNVEKATSGFPVVGQSTREEVLRRLGEPDDWSGSDSTFTYRWRMVVYKTPYFLTGCNAWADVRKTYFLRVVFGQDGVVQDCEFP